MDTHTNNNPLSEAGKESYNLLTRIRYCAKVKHSLLCAIIPPSIAQRTNDCAER